MRKIPRAFVINVLLIACVIGCLQFFQNPAYAKKEKAMERNTTALEQFNDIQRFYESKSTFDIEAFKKRKEEASGLVVFYQSEDGTNIKQWSPYKSDAYHEERSREDSPFILYSGFRKIDGTLNKKGIRFYGEGVYEVVEYDPKGKVIKKTRYDTDFPLQPEQLREKVKKDWEIDVFNTTQTRRVIRSLMSINRQPEHPYYLIITQKDSESGIVDVYLYDGKNGTFLYRVLGAGETEVGIFPDVAVEYQKHLQEEEKRASEKK